MLVTLTSGAVGALFACRFQLLRRVQEFTDLRFYTSHARRSGDSLGARRYSVQLGGPEAAGTEATTGSRQEDAADAHVAAAIPEG